MVDLSIGESNSDGSSESSQSSSDDSDDEHMSENSLADSPSTAARLLQPQHDDSDGERLCAP